MIATVFEITYHGKQPGKVWVQDGDEIQPLPLRLDLRDHSPTGFQWGYGGSGPAQLALALLADATGDDELATRLYQDFKWDVVSKLPWSWDIWQQDVLAWVRKQKEGV